MIDHLAATEAAIGRPHRNDDLLELDNAQLIGIIVRLRYLVDTYTAMFARLTVQHGRTDANCPVTVLCTRTAAAKRPQLADDTPTLFDAEENVS